MMTLAPRAAHGLDITRQCRQVPPLASLRERRRAESLECDNALAKATARHEDEAAVASILKEDVDLAAEDFATKNDLHWRTCERSNNINNENDNNNATDMTNATNATLAIIDDRSKLQAAVVAAKKAVRANVAAWTSASTTAKTSGEEFARFTSRLALRNLQKSRVTLAAAQNAVKSFNDQCALHKQQRLVALQALAAVRAEEKRYGQRVARAASRAWAMNATCNAKRAAWAEAQHWAATAHADIVQAKRGVAQAMMNEEKSRDHVEHADKEKEERAFEQQIRAQPCARRTTCRQCSMEVADDIAGNGESCGWCTLTKTCEAGTKEGPLDWDCSNPSAELHLFDVHQSLRSPYAQSSNETWQ